MHIGIVAPCTSGLLADLLPESEGRDVGCGGFLIATLVRALTKRGHSVSVITLSKDITESVVLKGPQLTYYVYRMRTRKRMRDVFRLERQGLQTGIAFAQPDILHAHWTYEFALPCLDSNLPTVVTCHDNAFQELRFSKDLYRLGRLFMQLQVIRRSTHLTAVSPYLAKSLQWLTRTKIEVIPNPIQIPSVYYCTSPDSRREQIKIATVLNGWGERKNPKPAIQAFDLFRRDYPDAEMFMYGDGFERGGPAHRWSIQRRITNIHFQGEVPFSQLQRELATMSLLLHPAVEESFGMAVVEAIALGLPVVAGQRAGGVPWVLDYGRAGYLTDVRSPAEIASALKTCIEDRKGREERGKNGVKRLAALFAPDTVAAQYEQVYNRVLSASTRQVA